MNSSEEVAVTEMTQMLFFKAAAGYAFTIFFAGFGRWLCTRLESAKTWDREETSLCYFFGADADKGVQQSRAHLLFEFQLTCNGLCNVAFGHCSCTWFRGCL